MQKHELSLVYTFSPRPFSRGVGHQTPPPKIYIDSDPPAFIGLGRKRSVLKGIESYKEGKESKVKKNMDDN